MTSRKTSRQLGMEAEQVQAQRRKLFLSWSKVEEHCRDLRAKIVDYQVHSGVPVKTIVAVARGGLVPATILAHMLDVKHVSSISVSSYIQDFKQGAVTASIPDIVKTLLNEPTTLLVDDIVDSGDTLLFLRNCFPRALSAAMVIKSSSPVAPNYYGYFLDTDDWVVFPWERVI